MDAARVKGNSFASNYRCFERLYGKEKGAALVARLKDRAFALAYATTVVRNAWYPFEDLEDVWESMEAVCGNGDGSIVRRVAGESAVEDLNGFLKIFLATFGTPSMFAGKSALLWKNYYEGGQLALESAGPGTLELALRDWPQPNRYHCASIVGWAERSLELTRAKRVTVEHTECRTRGGAVCRFRVRWQE